MNKIVKFLIVILISIFTFNCSEYNFSDDYTNTELPRVKPIFTDIHKQNGLFVSENITSIIEEFEEEKIDLKNSNKLLELVNEKSYNFYIEKGLISKSEKSSFLKNKTNSSRTDLNLLKNSLNKLSKKQKEVLREISIARKESKSYIEFSNRLATINNEIYTSIPQEEQARLLNTTAILYYSLEAMDELANRGLIRGRSEGNEGITLAKLSRLGAYYAHAQSSETSESSWWEFSGDELSAMWVIALAEPTPAGEVIASLATAGYATYMIGSIISDFIISFGTSTGNTLEDCIDDYVDCQDNGGSNCDDDLHACRSAANQ